MTDQKPKNPIQPIIDGRFKANAIVKHLLDWSSERGMSLNGIAQISFSNDDRQQFAQLIGYSLSGYADLGYVDSDAWGAASTMADEGLTEKDARIAHLEHEIFMLRSSLRDPVARLYGIHPDDLRGEDD